MNPENASLHPPTIGDPNVDNSPPAAPPPAESPEVAALRAELERERTAAAEREQRYLQTLDSLMTRNAAPAAAEPAPAPASLDLNDLPDPVQAPTEFKTKLVEKVTGFVTQNSASAQQQLLGQMTRAQALDNLWNRFNADPQRAELGKRTALLQGAAAVTFNELRQRGIDPVTIAAQNPDSLIGAIVTRMQAELGTTGQPGAAPAAPSGARAATVASASGPAAPAGPAPAKAPSFVEQHTSARRALGIGY